MKVKVTVQVTLTLPPGGEVIENIRSNDEDMGAHIKVGGKLFRPYVEWLVFLPGTPRSESERTIGTGNQWRTCDTRDYNTFLADEENPGHDSRWRPLNNDLKPRPRPSHPENIPAPRIR